MKLLNLILVLPLTAAISGCGGGGPLDAAGGAVEQSQVQGALTKMFDVLDSLELSGNATPSFPEVGDGRGPSVSPGTIVTRDFSGCTDVAPSTLVDEDSDGIALKKTYTYDCSGVVDGTTTMDLKGKIVFIDKDDTVAGLLGGYRADYDNEFSFLMPGTYDMTYQDVGYFDVSRQGGSYIFDVEYKSVGKGTSHGYQADFTWQSTWNHKITPTATGVGKLSFSGYFMLDGVYGDPDEPEYSVVFEIKSTNLEYDYNTCTYFKTGSISFKDGSGNEVLVEYSCTDEVVTFNGEVMPTVRTYGGMKRKPKPLP